MRDLPFDHPDNVQPQQLRLPDFEGDPVRRAVMKLSGSIDGYVGAFGLEDHIYLVVEAEVSKVAHIEADGAIVREHTAKVVEAYTVPEDLKPAQLFTQARELAATLSSLAEQVDGQGRFGDDTGP